MSGNLSIGLNAKNDIYRGADGNLAMVTGVTAVEQDCACAMKSQKGEILFDRADGMPTFDDIWQSQKFIKWEAAGRAMLLAINGVVAVKSFVIAVNKDTFSYVATIETIYSPTLSTISGIVGG